MTNVACTTERFHTLRGYLQYSKRIVLFGIAQWAVVAVVSLYIAAFVSPLSGAESTQSIVNNVITCSSTLAVAICGGYYAHSAYDNNLRQRSTSDSSDGDETATAGNG